MAVLGAFVLPARAAASAPSLRLVGLAPLTLHGAGFSTGERVRVSIVLRRVRDARTIRSDRSGRFTFRYGTLVAIDPCNGTIVVTATGASSGRTATWKRPCRTPDPLP